MSNAGIVDELQVEAAGRAKFLHSGRDALWIPAGVRHELRMEGAVEMQSLYFHSQRLHSQADPGGSCQPNQYS